MVSRFRLDRIGVASLVFAAGAWAATGTITWDSTYQTVEGNGFFGPMAVWWSGGPFYNDTWGNLIMQDLGVTMWRNEYFSEEGSQDANWAKQTSAVQSLKTRSDALGVNLKFIYSVWSPPSQWKSNRSLKNGGTLEPANYANFGNWLKAGVKNYADIGIQLYALSPQNEPAFAQFYNSCVYTPEQYRDMIKVAGPIVHATYPNVKFFGPEDMLVSWSNGFPGRTMADPISKAQMGAMAVHGYSDGVAPTPSSQVAAYWSAAARNCKTAGIPLWMTETSGHAADWNGSFELANTILAAYKYGKIAAWVYWYGIDDLCNTTSLTKKGYVSKMFFRYVRPGAVMRKISDMSTDNVFAVAFTHATERTMTVVAINRNSANAQLVLAGPGLPTQFQAYRTTSGDNCVNAGTTGSTFTLAGNSVMTFVATNFDAPTVGVQDGVRASVRPGSVGAVSRTYDLRGRSIESGVAGGNACRVKSDVLSGRGAVEVMLNR